LVSMLLGSSACASGAEVPAASEMPSATSPSVDVLDLSDCREDVCEAPLEPGRYRATFYGRTLDFEISSPGWIWHYFYNFRFIADETPIEGVVTSDSINFLAHPRIAKRNCEESADPSVGHSVEDLVSWLEAAPGLVVSEPMPVNVGGLDGFRLDLQIDPAWKRTCFFSEGSPPFRWSSMRRSGARTTWRCSRATRCGGTSWTRAMTSSSSTSTTVRRISRARNSSPQDRRSSSRSSSRLRLEDVSQDARSRAGITGVRTHEPPRAATPKGLECAAERIKA
jgi:hypothetical protein